MARISKPPEIRKQEILDTAMRLFSEKGYESTSMADIAKELHVVQGLCYRYFTSKQELFDAAMEQYVKENCAVYLPIIHDRRDSIIERMEKMFMLFGTQEDNSKYHDFYHKPENEALHLQLSLKIGEYLSPHISQELAFLCERGELSIENPESLMDFITYGQVGVLLGPHSSHRKREYESNDKEIKYIRKYVTALLGIKE